MLTDSNYLTVGVYNNGAGLTSVDGTPLKRSDFTNLNLPQNQIIRDNLNPTISLFGGKTGDNGNYSSSVGPTNVQVKLTLVSSSGNNPSGLN